MRIRCKAHAEVEGRWRGEGAMVVERNDGYSRSWNTGKESSRDSRGRGQSGGR